MTIGIPSIFSYQSSNVTDPATTLDELLENCKAPVFDKGLEVQEGEWVYEYQGKINFIPKVYSAHDEAQGIYNLDEIILKDCKLVKVTGKSGTGITTHRRPKEPNEYKKFDYNMNYKSWRQRYIKVSSKIKCNWLERTWSYASRQYAIQWNGCTNRYEWVARDTRVSHGCPTAVNAIKVSSKYSSGADQMATIIKWGSVGQSRLDTVRIRSMVERKGYFYLRTNVNAPLEYATWKTGTAYQYTYQTIESPADINGFTKKRRINAHNPFDDKNYTKTVFDTTYTDGKATWTLLATSPFDSIAFGHVITDTIDFVVTDQNAKVLFEINNYSVDNSVAPGRSEEHPSTIVLYTDKTCPAGSIVNITLKNDIVEIGEMMPASKLEAGFTKMAFKNKFKDFSPKEQDQWGNFYYKDGVRVSVHTGTVEFPVVSYDMLNRLMLMIGGQKVVINSSDSIKNELPDGYTVFEATMMIARFTSFELATTEKHKRMGEIAKYNFTIEELV